MSTAIILAATTDDAMYFKVGGRATFTCCIEMRDYAEKLLKGAFDVVAVDIEDCTGMDSTFMGLLAMLGIERMQNKLSNVTIINAGPSNMRLLEELGLTQLFDFANNPPLEVEWHEIFPIAENDRPAVISLEGGRLMLQAHKTLMELDEGNVPKFRGVVDSLESELDDMN